MKLALDKWYHSSRSIDQDEWISEFPTALHPETDVYLKLHQEWCQDQTIFKTPTIIVNGKQLPEQYSMEDLELFLRQAIN